MKRILLIMILTAALAAPVLAMPTVTVGRMAGTYPVAPLSGEFTLTPNADLMAITGETGPFQSFCIEVHEAIAIGTTYDAIVNDEAILGDGRWPAEAAGPDGGDMLDPRTAYLYTQFRNGTLAGYDFTPGSGRESSALNLQTAIWYLEYEVGYRDYDALSPESQGFLTLAENSGWTDIGKVRVLNLTESKAVRQDMLILVPAPGAILLGGLGVCLVGWLKKRRAL